MSGRRLPTCNNQRLHLWLTTRCERLHVCMPPTVCIFIKGHVIFWRLCLIYVFTDTITSVWSFAFQASKTICGPYGIALSLFIWNPSCIKSVTYFIPPLVFNSVLPVWPQGRCPGTLSAGTAALLQERLSGSVMCHKTPLVGIWNAQEMALFGSVQSQPGTSKASSQANPSPSSALSKVFVWCFCCWAKHYWHIQAIIWEKLKREVSVPLRDFEKDLWKW